MSLIRHKRVKERFPEIEVELEDHDIREYEMQIEKSRHLIELLPAHRRTCLRNVFRREKYQEAADDLGISINTVKTHMSIKR